MARPAPAVERIVAIIEFLAARPDRAFTLSELARRLGLNKATVHAALNSLVEAGWLIRHPGDKSYALGPALVTIGAAAAARQRELVDFAEPEMHALADELGLQCIASAVIGDEMVILARAGRPAPLEVSVPVGQRLPLVPPLGTVFVAWASPDEIEAWLRRVGPSAGPRQLDRYRSALAAIRARGYSIALEAGTRARLATALGDRREVEALIEKLGHEEYALAELDSSAAYEVSLLSAPVFGPDGRVALALTLFGFRGQLPAGQIPEFGERLKVAADAVTRAIHGRPPV
jgi:DNA-binding IclR family transcriptional regulator